jgi:glutamate synthase (NADPH/NADH) large chain
MIASRAFTIPWFEHDACGVGLRGGHARPQIAPDPQHGLQVLRNLDHRGASGSEINTGDGAGILLQIPHKFLSGGLQKRARFTLPAAGEYGCGLIFLPRNPTVRRKIEEKFEQVVQSEGHLPRLAHRAHQQCIARRHRQVLRAVHAPVSSSAAAPT